MSVDTIFGEIIINMEKMEETGKIDPSIMNKLNTPIYKLKNFEDCMTKEGTLSIEDSFALYHIARNIRIILEKMKEKFFNANKAGENPKVVEDALNLLPQISEVYSALYTVSSKPLNDEIKLFLTNKLRKIRNTAAGVSMLPSLDEEIKEVDVKLLKEEIEAIVEDLGAPLHEE